jgi:hypothetical protein
MADLEVDIPRLEEKLNEPLKTASFIELKELIDRVKEKKDVLFAEKFKMLCHLFTAGIVLKRLSPHFWAIEIHWEIWGIDKGVIWLSKGAQTDWTTDMLETLKTLYDKGAAEEEFLEAFPSHSPLALYRAYKTAFKGKLFPIATRKVYSFLSLDDRQVVRESSLKLEDLKFKTNTVFFTDYIQAVEPEDSETTDGFDGDVLSVNAICITLK